MGPEEPRLGVTAVANRVNELLLVRSPDGWSTPTVRLRRGETLVEAAVRAVGEQCGLEALSGPSLGWYESFGADPFAPDGHRVILSFTVVVLDTAEPRPGVGILETRWMPVWEASELPMEDGLAGLLAEHGVIDTLT